MLAITEFELNTLHHKLRNRFHLLVLLRDSGVKVACQAIEYDNNCMSHAEYMYSYNNPLGN
jgi:hypothetical protein